MTEKKDVTGTTLYFSGPESFLLREHVQKYFVASEKKYGEYNVLKMNPEEKKFGEIKTELLSVPFFNTGKKIVFLDPFPLPSSEKMSEVKKEKSEKIIELLKGIPEDIVIICVSEHPDKRTKAWKDLIKIAQKDISRSFEPLNERTLTQWVLQRVSAKEGKILPAAAEYLWQYAGKNLWVLDQEVQKLINFSEGKPISERDIEIVCDVNSETIEWALSNAFSTGQRKEVLKIFHRMIDAGQSAYTLLFRDFGSLLRQLLLVRQALDTRSSAKDIGMSPFLFGKMKKVAEQFSLSHLKNMQDGLLKIDEGSKTGLIPTSTGKEELLIFALEKWIYKFFRKNLTKTF